MISPQLQSTLDYPSTLVYRSVYDGRRRVLRATDGSLASLHPVGEAMLPKVEQEEGGEWYLAMIQCANGDFHSFPHPEAL